MDERVEGLLSDFPAIFEKHPPRIGELEDDWVVIDLPEEKLDSAEEQLITDDTGITENDFLSDLDRFEETVEGQRKEESFLSPINIPASPRRWRARRPRQRCTPRPRAPRHDQVNQSGNFWN